MKKLAPRDVLFREGESDGKLYFIRKGNLIVQKKEGSKIRSEGILGQGATVGEASLLFGEPHPFTLRAMEPVEAEEFSNAELSNALKALPDWFHPFLRFLADRVRNLEVNKSQLDKIHALPTLLFLSAKRLKHAENGTLELFPLLEDLKTINGLGFDDAFELLRAICKLGIAELIPGEQPQIRYYRSHLPELLYRTLLTRMAGKKLPNTLLSANDQTLLTAFISAAKTKGREDNGCSSVFAKDFFSTYQKLFPGLHLSRRQFENLIRCTYLRTVPDFASISDIQAVERFCADLESVKDLTELNRVYPLLDKRLPEAMKNG